MTFVVRALCKQIVVILLTPENNTFSVNIKGLKMVASDKKNNHHINYDQCQRVVVCSRPIV